MAETQRQAVPRNDGGEVDTGLAFLTFARECVIKKTEGLPDEQLRQVMVESGTSLLGLIQHLTDAEHYWIGYHVAGRGVADYDFSMDVPATRPATEVIEAYRDAITESDEILAGLSDFNQLVAIPTDEERHTVRWVIAHMTGVAISLVFVGGGLYDFEHTFDLRSGFRVNQTQQLALMTGGRFFSS